MVDATTGHEVLFFMDESSRYNQIRMALSNEEMSTFKTSKGIYFYKVMPFGLKNAGATYQRAMQKVFDDMLHKFISKLAGRCQPFQKLMRKGENFVWDEACQNGFDSIRKYLLNPTALGAPVPKEEKGKEHALYYLSRTLVGAKVNYSSIEKMCLALFFAMDKLRHYMQVFTVNLVAKADPIKSECNNKRWIMLSIFSECQEANVTTSHLIDKEDWRQTIREYLKHGILPKDSRHKTELRRIGYYWHKMVQDSMDYAKKCETCQYHANFTHRSPEPLHSIVVSWSFEAWGLDLVGFITPKSSAGHSYILAATDYFLKWAEAIPLKEAKKENVANFIRNHRSIDTVFLTGS
ncbi:gypsy-like retrotransposase [Cucumis melo var. makuwa]|uniref:Gypsy-like retrotransposase n=2 Tax=Cucumis melo var. makuwa TaxID=1194695 RepID=A0A5A7TU67_CUCMM|nr:gypsy-like retrotransposase [Cucumis melo var. makuwa]